MQESYKITLEEGRTITSKAKVQLLPNWILQMLLFFM